MTHSYNLRIGAALAVLVIAVSAFVGWSGLPVPALANGDDWGMVEVSEVTKTEAKVTITFVDETATGTVHWRYRRTMPEGQWLGLDRVSVIGGISIFSMARLSPGTEYELQVSLDGNFPQPDILSKKFTTTPPDPSVSEVIVEKVTLTEATVVITIANPGTSSKTVYVRYRTDDTQPWSNPPITITTVTGTAMKKLSGLSPGTRYEVEASLGDGFLPTETESTTFTTFLPRVSGVSLENVTTSEATVKVTIAEPGPGVNKVHLRYSIVPSTQSSWATPSPKVVVGDTTTFALTGLAPDSEYVVQVSLDDAFTTGVESATFTTAAPPSIGSVNMAGAEQNSASAIVSIFDSDGTSVTVHLRYRETPSGAWIALQPKTTTTEAAQFTLSGLRPDTEYEVEVSMDNRFSLSQSTFFITEAMTSRPSSPVVRISGLFAEDITPGSVTVIVMIAGPENRVTVNLRYRVEGTNTWSRTLHRTTATDTAPFELGGLTAATNYEIEASLAPDFPVQDSAYDIFTTAAVRVSGVRLEDITDTEATAIADIEDPQGGTTVYVRYRALGTGAWSEPQSRITNSSTVRLFLTGLLPDTQYEVEASSEESFPGDNSALETFVTEPAPGVSEANVEGITNVSATIAVDIDSPQAQMKIYLRFRVEGTGIWSTTRTRTTSIPSARFSLTDLKSDTGYEYEMSLDKDFPSDSTVFAVFSTQPNPKVSDVTVEDITEKSGTAIVKIDGPQPRTTVYLRHRAHGDSAWSVPQTRTTSLDTARFTLSGLMPDTEYEVEVSLNHDFEEFISETFLTAAKRPKPSSVTGGPITQTTASIIVHIDNPQGSLTIHLRIRIWGSITWNNLESQTTSTSTAPFDLSRLTGGITYEVEVSLESAFPPADTVSAIFTTTPATKVSGVNVGSVTAVEATVTVTIVHPEGNTRTVYMRYRGLPEGDWSASQTETDASTMDALLPGLIPDMEYEVQASLYETFPATDRQVRRFKTLSATPTPTPTPVPTATPIPTPIPVPTATPTPTPIPVSTATPTPTPTPVPTATPTPTPIPVSTATPTSKAEPTMTPTPPPPPSPTPLPSLTPTPTATPSHTSTPTNTPKPAETPAPTSTAISPAVPLLSPTPAPTSTSQTEEEETGTDLALVITIVTLVIAFAMVLGFFVYRPRMGP